MSEINLALRLMVYGLSGVFLTLILFYVAIKLLTKIFPYKEEEQN